MASRRSGTACVKYRSEVEFSGSKIYRQKGLGRARHGSKRAPIFVGGGSVFGPKPRDFSFKVNKKVRVAALRNAISYKLAENHLLVLDKIELKEAKTKYMVQVLKDLSVKSALFVTSDEAQDLCRASRNIPGCKCTRVEGLNVVDILAYEDLVILQPALDQIEKRLEKK
jgi:large subunit ribosomal protein L4